MMQSKLSISVVLVIVLCCPVMVLALGQTRYVQFSESPGSFRLAQGDSLATLYVDDADYAGVVRAAKDLQADIQRVTGKSPSLIHDQTKLGTESVIIGTVGKSTLIDLLMQTGKIDVTPIKGKWESFLIQVVTAPMPGVEHALVIAGSDKRGTIYGIYDLSEQMGVSPWYWWGDVPTQHREAVFIKAGKFVQGEPSVKYRGIFLNDEAPDLSNWVRATYGTAPTSEEPPIPSGVSNYGHEFYTRIFETLLRLKGNYLWPAMWNNAFNEDDPENPRLADEYGIVMGTSHQEPMLRAQKEWDRRYRRTLGSWNYYKHPDVLQDFWREGIRRNKAYESILTIGLRGANDSPMIPGGTVPESIALLEKIVAVQRQMIAEELNPDVTQVPQLWCLYKEVQEYYTKGLRVPDDVTLLWADDNWGDVRRLPTAAERQRSGGAGVYYHFDYVGGPRNYKWINTISIPKVWEQMSLAKAYGADRIWIVNVGHFKHLMFPLEFFMNLAWDTSRWNNHNLREYTRRWAEREFGPTYADDIAEIITQYTRYNSRRKPELLDPTIYSLTDYQEADTVVANFNALTAKADAIYEKLPDNAKDAFYELVLFPTKACAQVNELYVTAGKNALYAQQGRAGTNDLADKVETLFQADADLMNYYNHTFAGGKWNHFMDQTHIGYTSWQDPRRNVMPRVTRIDAPQAADMGIAVEGSESAWPDAEDEAVLPGLDVFNQQRRYIDVFNKGKIPFEFSATTNTSWIKLSERQGTVEKEQRIWVSADWSQVPQGSVDGIVTIRPTDGNSVHVKIQAFNPQTPSRETLQGFVEADGYLSIEAEHYTKKIDAGSIRWEKIEDYGRTLSAMSIMPMTAESVTPPQNAPCLEYKTYLFDAGEVNFFAIVAPSLNFDPERGVRFAVSFDDQSPQTIEVLPQGFDARNGNRVWENSVRNACHVAQTTLSVNQPGFHTLKIWMVDPAVVLEKIILDLGGKKPNYLGPPESYHR